jgi:hypothetical protein
MLCPDGARRFTARALSQFVKQVRRFFLEVAHGSHRVKQPLAAAQRSLPTDRPQYLRAVCYNLFHGAGTDAPAVFVCRSMRVVQTRSK